MPGLTKYTTPVTHPSKKTEQEWNTSDEILELGQIGVATDTLTAKIGDGVRKYKDLPNLFMDKVKYEDSNVKEIFISLDGNDSTGDGTAAKPYLSLSKAFNSIPDISNSTYRIVVVAKAGSSYNLSSTLVFEYKNIQGLEIEGRLAGTEKPAFKSTGSNYTLNFRNLNCKVSLKNVIFDFSTSSSTSTESGIIFTKIKNVELTDVELKNFIRANSRGIVFDGCLARVNNPTIDFNIGFDLYSGSVVYVNDALGQNGITGAIGSRINNSILFRAGAYFMGSDSIRSNGEVFYGTTDYNDKLDLFISPTGNDYTGDGSSGKPLATIRRALNLLLGTKINQIALILSPGTHVIENGQFTVLNPFKTSRFTITSQGESSTDSTIIQFASGSTEDFTMINFPSIVDFSSLTFDGNNNSISFKLERIANLIFYNCKLKDFTETTLKLFDIGNFQLTDTEITGTKIGIYSNATTGSIVGGKTKINVSNIGVQLRSTNFHIGYDVSIVATNKKYELLNGAKIFSANKILKYDVIAFDARNQPSVVAFEDGSEYTITRDFATGMLNSIVEKMNGSTVSTYTATYDAQGRFVGLR